MKYVMFEILPMLMTRSVAFFFFGPFEPIFL